MVALFPWIIAVGVSTASAVVKDTVTVLPILAYVVSALLDAIDIVAPVGESIIEGVGGPIDKNENQDYAGVIYYLLKRRGYVRPKTPKIKA